MIYFRYDHLRKEAFDVETTSVDRTAEPWRSAVESAFTDYVHLHFKNGAVAVYGSSSGDLVTLAVYIESHQFNPKNYWSVSFLPIGYIIIGMRY